MISILGISAFYHDSAAALIIDGKIVAAAQEERFTRKKHDAGFPRHAIHYCLKEAKIAANHGETFGCGGEGVFRFNFAMPKVILERAIERLINAFI